MQAILNNPYRVLGLLAGASARETGRQVRHLRMYIDAGQTLGGEDFSFPVLGRLGRTADAVNAASSGLSLDEGKMAAALFWFVRGHAAVDNAAFDALQSSDVQRAEDLWIERVEAGVVRQNNWSAFHNLSTLLLVKPRVLKADMERAIGLKLQFLESDYFDSLKSLVCDVTYTTTKKDMELLFLGVLQKEFEGSPQRFNTFISILAGRDFTGKGDFLKSIAQRFTSKIEVQIETTRRARTADKQQSAAAGETLCLNAKADLTQLKKLCGAESYANVADKVANEVLQCSIDFFNDSQDKGLNNDYHEKAVRLVEMAQAIAIGSLVKGRAADALRTLAGMKEKEIQAAITAMQMIKVAYAEACKRIDAQVQLQSMTLGWNQSINWSKVEEIKRNALDWNKVNDLLKEVLSDSNIDKIRNCPDAAQKEQFEQLAEWIRSHTTSRLVINKALNRYYGRKKYEETATSGWIGVVDNTRPASTHKPSHSTSPASKESPWFSKNAWWIFGLIGGFIGASEDNFWMGAIIGAIVGVVVGWIVKAANE